MQWWKKKKIYPKRVKPIIFKLIKPVVSHWTKEPDHKQTFPSYHKYTTGVYISTRHKSTHANVAQLFYLSQKLTKKLKANISKLQEVVNKIRSLEDAIFHLLSLPAVSSLSAGPSSQTVLSQQPTEIGRGQTFIIQCISFRGNHFGRLFDTGSAYGNNEGRGSALNRKKKGGLEGD